MSNPREHIKKNYADEINKCIIEMIKKANSYFEDEKERIDITNREISKNIKTEFVALKVLQDDNYEFIKIENEINKNFEFIEIEDTLIELVSNISREIDSSYQLIFLKQKDSNVIFDYEALDIITDFIRWTIKSVKLLHKFKAKDKKGFRPLKPYLNSLLLIIDNSYNEALKKEAQREYEYYKTIESEEKIFKENGFVFERIKLHNESYLNVNNLRNKYFNYIPKKTLNRNNCKKLEKFIKAEITKIIPKY